ncbi:hypothetical protein ACH5RR_028706 [Cinchona calisaya]|uniref:Chaperone DnaJ C-terminal domain-containing protein n=1 Tax=Cinchona calisaya TaxID=153742 RepID=A0ABD2YTH4_9GENT
MLSDPQKRAVYDQYGEERLKCGVPVPPPVAGGPCGATYFSTGREQPTSGFSWFPIPFVPFVVGCSGPGGPMCQPPPRKAAPIEEKLYCTLEDPYGDSQENAVSPEKFSTPTVVCGYAVEAFYFSPVIEHCCFIVCTPNSSGLTCCGSRQTIAPKSHHQPSFCSQDHVSQTQHDEVILNVDAGLGWKKGQKIIFPDKGNKLPRVLPGDLVFIIDEKPHPVFTTRTTWLLL